MAQFARPDSDVTNTGSNNGFEAIDESTPSDADFWWGDNNQADELEVGLTNVTDPGVDTGHVVRFRIAKVNAGVLSGTGNAVTITARLMQGGTVIAARAADDATGTWTTHTWNLTTGEVSGITDYTDLRLEFVTSASGGTPANRRGGAVSWAELETPDAPSGDRRMQVSFAEFEVPNAPRRMQVSWAELEVPTAPRRMQVSWAELEVPTAPRRMQVSWAEVEVPTAPRRMQVSWAEFEVPDEPTTDRRAQVSFAELEIPEAPTTDRRMRLSWAEFETPNAARRMRMSFVELELESAPRRMLLSWVEFEVPTAPRRGRVSFAELQVPDAGGGEPPPPGVRHSRVWTIGIETKSGG